MCVGSPASASPAVPKVEDTSKDPIVSKFDLSEADKKENARRAKAKNKAKSLIYSGGQSDDNPSGTPTTGGTSFGTGRGTSNDAYGGSYLA